MSQLAELEQRLSRLETARGLVWSDVDYQEIHALAKRVEAMTREIFDGDVTYCEREDDEIPNDRHFTFTVVDTGEVDAV